jgi:hypothetical protein
MVILIISLMSLVFDKNPGYWLYLKIIHMFVIIKYVYKYKVK